MHYPTSCVPVCGRSISESIALAEAHIKDVLRFPLFMRVSRRFGSDTGSRGSSPWDFAQKTRLSVTFPRFPTVSPRGSPDIPWCIHRLAPAAAMSFHRGSSRSQSHSSTRGWLARAAAAYTTRRPTTASLAVSAFAALSTLPAARSSVPCPCPPASPLSSALS
jgi:hypothetical protein